MLLAGIITGYIFYSISIFVQVMVIIKKIPYNLVNGGRSESYKEQLKTSIVSIFVLILGLILIVSFHMFIDLHKTLFGVIVTGILSLYWIMGLLMQLLGTSFEKKYLSGVLLLGIFSHIVIFILYFIN